MVLWFIVVYMYCVLYAAHVYMLAETSLMRTHNELHTTYPSSNSIKTVLSVTVIFSGIDSNFKNECKSQST